MSKRTVEEAMMQPTMPVKLAKFFIALKFSDLTKGKPGYGKAATLAKDAYADLDKSALIRLGFPKYWNDKAPSFEVIRSTNFPVIKKIVKEKFANNPKVSAEEASILQVATAFLVRHDPSAAQITRAVAAANKISTKFGSSLPSGDAVEGKTEGASNVDGMYAELRDIVKKLTGKVGIKVAQDQLTKAKTGTAAQATLVSKYNEVRRRIASKYDAELAAYLSKQEKPPYVHEAYAAMNKAGFETQKIINTNGKKVPLKVNLAAGKIVYLTEDGREIDGGIPADAIEIKFMKTYDPAAGTGAYLSYTTANANGVTRKYTTAHKAEAGKQKFDKADMVAENISKYVTKWSRDLSSRDDTVAMAATVCMLIYKTGMRVGSSVASRSISGEKAYGALTLLNKQVAVSTSKITLKYIAKKQVPQTNVILIKDKVDKILLRNIKEFKQGKGPEELLFAAENHKGVMKRLLPQQLNTYLKSMGYTAGIHKIRHVRGTNLAVELLNSKPWRPTKEENKTLAKRQASAEAYIKNKILEPVADLLGHKSKDGKALWSTSISNYLNPKPFIKWFNDQGLRVPKWVPKNTN